MSDDKANRIFTLLEKVAMTSDHSKHSLAAAIAIRSKVVSFGVNRMKSDPMQAKYGRNQQSIYLHAEIHAIKNFMRQMSVDDLRRADLYVLRLRNDNKNRALAKPCEGCMRAIAEFGIRSVTYTNDLGACETI